MNTDSFCDLGQDTLSLSFDYSICKMGVLIPVPPQSHKVAV